MLTHKYKSGELQNKILNYLTSNPTSLRRLVKDTDPTDYNRIKSDIHHLKSKDLVRTFKLKFGIIKSKTYTFNQIFVTESEDRYFGFNGRTTLYYRPSDEELLGLEIICRLRDNFPKYASITLSGRLLRTLPIRARHVVEAYLLDYGLWSAGIPVKWSTTQHNIYVKSLRYDPKTIEKLKNLTSPKQ